MLEFVACLAWTEFNSKPKQTLQLPSLQWVPKAPPSSFYKAAYLCWYPCCIVMLSRHCKHPHQETMAQNRKWPILVKSGTKFELFGPIWICYDHCQKADIYVQGMKRLPNVRTVWWMSVFKICQIMSWKLDGLTCMT